MVLNLPWQTSWQALKEFFSPAGNITRADIAVDDTGRRGRPTHSLTHSFVNSLST